MNDTTTRKAWGGLIAMLVVGVTGACNQEIQTPVADENLLNIDGPVVFGMVSYLTSSGVREGRVEADTAYVFEDSTAIHLRQMEITFFDEAGRPNATVTGLRGRWNQDTDVMLARGDVELFVFADSSVISSAEIHYDPNLDRIWSDSATTQTAQDGTTTRGSSFESDISFENILIRDIRGGARRVF